jgi:hypothetical protein
MKNNLVNNIVPYHKLKRTKNPYRNSAILNSIQLDALIIFILVGIEQNLIFHRNSLMITKILSHLLKQISLLIAIGSINPNDSCQTQRQKFLLIIIIVPVYRIYRIELILDHHHLYD